MNDRNDYIEVQKSFAELNQFIGIACCLTFVKLVLIVPWRLVPRKEKTPQGLCLLQGAWNRKNVKIRDVKCKTLEFHMPILLKLLYVWQVKYIDIHMQRWDDFWMTTLINYHTIPFTDLMDLFLKNIVQKL